MDLNGKEFCVLKWERRAIKKWSLKQYGKKSGFDESIFKLFEEDSSVHIC